MSKIYRRYIPVTLILALIIAVTYGAGQAWARHYISGGLICWLTGDTKIAVPEEYDIIEVRETPGRLLIAVQKFSEPGNLRSEYVSEIWQFKVGRGLDASEMFADRQVFCSIESVGGIRDQRFRRTVNCEQGTAVYVEGYERGDTLVFDENGDPIEVDWSTCKSPTDRSAFSFVRPLTWLTFQEDPIEPYYYKLVCVGSNLGTADTHLLIYDLQTGNIEIASLESGFTEFGESMIRGIFNQH